MGWKSTIFLTRDQAIEAIIKSMNPIPFDEMSNDQLEDMMYGLNIGDDTNKPYYGYTFSVFDTAEDVDNFNKGL
jgi:hypothetical protein